MADAFESGLSAVKPISIADAAGMLGKQRETDAAAKPVDPPKDQTSSNEPPADTGPVQDDPPRERADDENTAPDDDQVRDDADETTDKDDPAEDLPPIQPPRSWSKEDKALFKDLPRATQERLAERERSRETDFLRRQQQIVEMAKAVQAKDQATDQAKTRYETGVEQLSEQLNAFIAGQFQDVKSWDDVQRMAVENPVRYNEWKVATDRAQALQAERARIAHENQQRQAQAFQNYEREQTAEFLKSAPEFADPKQGPQLAAETNAMLRDDYGLSEQELSALWGGAQVSALDHRFRLLIRDALAYKKTKAGLKPKPNPNPKPASPPPQRPGTPLAKGEAVNGALAKAQQNLARTHSVDDAVALLRAKRRASA